jgi:cell division protein ZapA
VAKVEININGRLYSVACDEGQEPRVRDLAQALDQRVRRVAGQGQSAPVAEPHLLVLAGLMLVDELSEAEAALECDGPAGAGRAEPGTVLLDGEEDLLVAAVDHLAERIETIAARLDRT